MKAKLTLIFFIVTIVFGCGKDNDGEYQNIAGTRLSIVAPPGFKPSENFIGLEKDQGTGIQVIDLVGGNFERDAATHTREIFEERGVTVLDMGDVTIDGFKGKFAHVTGDEQTEVMMVAFGDTTFSLSAMAMFPSNRSSELLSQIKQSLLTMKYDKKLKVDLLAAAYFKVVPHDSKFKFAKASGNMFIFSENGVVKKAYENEPMVIVTPLPFDENTTTDDMMQSLVSGLTQNGFAVEDVRNTSASKINGYQALSGQYYFDHNGVKKLAFLAVLVQKKRALAFYAIAEKDYHANMEEFEKVLQSLRFK